MKFSPLMSVMVKTPERRTDRCFLPGGSNSVTLVQFPAQRRQASSLQPATPARVKSDNGETEPKRIRNSGLEDSATNRKSAAESCDQTGSNSGSSEGGVSSADGVQQVALENKEDNRAAELASAGGLKVTIQRSSQNREFGEKEPSTERLTCHVCRCSCPSAQAFQQHMSEAEHQRRLLHITQSVNFSQHTGRRHGAAERWCDVCESHFTGDVILHRRSKEHKDSKKSSRPFCFVCCRHFRTPRKFVEHMKSLEHKQQVELEKAQDEEMITVDAIGCFESESETPFTSRTEEGGDEELGHKEHIELIDKGGSELGCKEHVGPKDRRGKEIKFKQHIGLKDKGGKELGCKEHIGLKDKGGKEIGCKEHIGLKDIKSKELGIKEHIGFKDIGDKKLGSEPERGGGKNLKERHEEEKCQATLNRLDCKSKGSKELGKEKERGDSEDKGDILFGDVDSEEQMEVDAHAEAGSSPQEPTSHPSGDSYVVPVSGFFCRLCHKFFFRKTPCDQHCLSEDHLTRVLQAEAGVVSSTESVEQTSEEPQ